MQFIVSPSPGGRAHRREMLEPGASYLITSVSDFNASRDAAGERTLEPFPDEGMDRMVKLFDKQRGNGRVEVSVDSIIFEDGTLAGPDTAERMDEINARINAEKDLIASLVSLHGQELRKKLLAPQLSQGSGPAASEYSRHMNGTAQAILAAIDSRESRLDVNW